MSQAERLLEMFRYNGGRLTLGQILDARISSKYTNRISEIRAMGHSVECKMNRDRPTETLYTLVEFKVDGQQRTFA